MLVVGMDWIKPFHSKNSANYLCGAISNILGNDINMTSGSIFTINVFIPECRI